MSCLPSPDGGYKNSAGMGVFGQNYRPCQFGHISSANESISDDCNLLLFVLNKWNVFSNKGKHKSCNIRFVELWISSLYCEAIMQIIQTAEDKGWSRSHEYGAKVWSTFLAINCCMIGMQIASASRNNKTLFHRGALAFTHEFHSC